MKRNLTFLAGLCLLLVFSTVIKAQTPEPSPKLVAIPQREGVKGKPYSAEGTGEKIQILADGNRIVTTEKQRMFQDSQGRTRTEYEYGNEETERNSIYIHDYVAGFIYRLNPESKTATRTSINSNKILTVTIYRPNGYSSKREDLGSKMIEGIEAAGNRFTTTIAPGTIGNEKTIERISENWSSPELGIVVYSKTIDPQMGNRTFQIKNVKREEPDAALFKVPGDYKIVDQKSLFPTPEE